MIHDVKVIRLTAHTDERGYLIEIARKAGGDEPHAVVHQFGQVYLVGNPARGAIRAFHKHAELWDWFFISHGSAKFVLKDDREDSPTYGEMMQIVIGERNPTLLVVPPGVYHGWMSLEDDTQMISTASHTYNRENPDEVRIPPDSFGDVWTIKGK
ncbi:MAG: dTDP-4-dehydrorhamnose 3,5-epimerase family protein [Anaerolineae bacterium]|jgi:dTDP-4-dehydrorhamnose 3,5-epimerase|nr:dTDP-4-dehydrorhamnose 3,5-epimerase family protein [Anaerolineae bacterium]